MLTIAGGILLAVFGWIVFCLIAQFFFYKMAESMDRPYVPRPLPKSEIDPELKAKIERVNRAVQ
jgi:hypothetical protein